MEQEEEFVNSQNDADPSMDGEGESDTQTDEETVEELREKNAKLFARAKKAEGFTLVNGEWKKKPVAISEKAPEKQEPVKEIKAKFSLEDLDEAAELLEIPKEDRREVAEYASSKGITVSEAKQKPFIVSFLKTQKEERTTAAATNTDKAPKRGGQTTGERVLSDYDKGVLPDTEEAGASLAEAQFKQLLNKGTK